MVHSYLYLSLHPYLSMLVVMRCPLCNSQSWLRTSLWWPIYELHNGHAPVIASHYDLICAVVICIFVICISVAAILIWICELARWWSWLILWKFSCHDDNFVLTGRTAGCHNDNLRCHQWWQNWHHCISWFSVNSRLILYCRRTEGHFIIFALGSLKILWFSFIYIWCKIVYIYLCIYLM